MMRKKRKKWKLKRRNQRRPKKTPTAKKTKRVRRVWETGEEQSLLKAMLTYGFDAPGSVLQKEAGLDRDPRVVKQKAESMKQKIRSGAKKVKTMEGDSTNTPTTGSPTSTLVTTKPTIEASVKHNEISDDKALTTTAIPTPLQHIPIELDRTEVVHTTSLSSREALRTMLLCGFTGESLYHTQTATLESMPIALC